MLLYCQKIHCHLLYRQGRSLYTKSHLLQCRTNVAQANQCSKRLRANHLHLVHCTHLVPSLPSSQSARTEAEIPRTREITNKRAKAKRENYLTLFISSPLLPQSVVDVLKNTIICLLYAPIFNVCQYLVYKYTKSIRVEDTGYPL